jgi:hypothetical protein
MRKIKEIVASYYRTAINGNYCFDGMPEISRGIEGWIEAKIWKLLVLIGEPNHSRYPDEEAHYWEKAH